MRPFFRVPAAVTLLGAILVLTSSPFADEKLNGFIAGGKYKEAIAYAKELPASAKNVGSWLSLAVAYEKSGGTKEEIINCFKSAQMANPSDPSVYLAFGDFYRKDKKYTEALEGYRKSYMLNKTAVSAEGMAVCFWELKQPDDALDAAESAVHLDSTLLESRQILAEIYIKQNDLKSAAEQLEQITRRKPGELKYWQQLVTCYEKTANNDKIAEVDPKIVELDKKNVVSRRRVVERSLQAKDTAKALILCKELAVLTPTDPKVFKFLYNLTISQGDKKSAILYLKNFLALDSSSAPSFKSLGDLLYEQKDSDGALDAYRKALKLEPLIKGFYKNYIDIVLLKGLEAEAVTAVKGAIVAGEADTRALVALGDIMKKRKEYASAIKAYQDALKNEPNNTVVLTSLGECQAKNGETANAMITYEQVVMLNTSAVKEYKELGDLQTKSGKTDAAMLSYKKYISKEANDGVAKKVGLFEYARKSNQEAIKYLEMVKDATLQDAEYLAALGDAYFSTNDLKKSADTFAKCRALKPSAAILVKILKLQAEAYEKTGDETKAAEAYDAFTQNTGVRDPDASFKKAFFREKTDKATASKMYQENTILFPKDARNFVRLGFIYAEDKGTYDKAVNTLTAASLLVDTNAAVWQKLGEISGKLGNEDKELAAYKKLLVSDPQNLVANKRAGTILIKKGQLQPGIANLAIAATMDSKDIDVMLLLADAYIKTKRKEEAASILKNAKVLKPEDVAIRLLLIKVAEEAALKDIVAKEKAELAELDKKIIAKDKKNVESRMRLTEYALSMKDSTLALGLCKELAILTPQNAQIFKNLFQISMTQGDKKNAILYLKNFLVLDSSSAASFKMLGDLMFEQKDNDGAAEAYRKALKLDPQIKGLYKNYIDIVLLKNQENEAVSVIKGAILANEVNARALIALGDILKKRKDFPGAIKAYQDALKLEPNNLVVLTSLGECQAKNGETANAMITYEQVTMLNSNASKEYKDLGDLQKLAGKIDAAMESYKKYLAKTATDNEVALRIGLFEFSKKRNQEAVKYLEKVKDAAMQDAQYFATIGEALYAINDLKKAAEAFVKARAQKPSAAIQLRIMKPLADAYEKTGEDLKAAEAYEAFTNIVGVRDEDASYKKAFLREKSDRATAVKMYQANTTLFPKDWRNFVRLGLISADDKAFEKAYAALSSAAALVDTIPVVWMKLGEMSFKMGNEDKELAAYKKLLLTDPQNLVANKRSGIILLKKGQSPQAITSLEMALTLDPSDTEVMLLLAGEYIKTKRPAQAIDLLAKAKAKKSDDVNIRLKLYELYKQSGQDDKAGSEMLGLIELKKENKYRLMYVRDLIGRKQYDAARKIVDEIKIADPENVETLMLLANIQKSQGKYDDAIETLKEVGYAKGGNYAPALYERGDVYQIQNNLTRAEEFYKKAVEADPKSGLGEFGLARIYKQKGNTAEYLKHLNKAAFIEPGNKMIADELAKNKKPATPQ